MIFRGSAPLPVIFRALFYIITGIHPAEAQVCANWVVLRKSVVLLAPLINFRMLTENLCNKFS